MSDDDESMSDEDKSRRAIGIALAVGGNLLVSVALNLTKHAHNLNQQKRVPLPYVRLPLWWLGFGATLLGELGNFAAYGFAEASVVAPLGAVSVLANAFIAALVLGEGLRLRDLLGCVLCIAGGSVIVTSTPTNSVDTDIGVFINNVQEPAFMMYIAVLSAVVMLMLGFQDKYGDRHVGYYVLLCSLIGSVTVMACKGVSTFLNLWLCCGADPPFTQPVLYLLLLVLGSTAVLQIRYLNQAMENFGNTETVPVYYVMFTVCTIAGSTILYKDFYNEDRWTVLRFCFGVVLTFMGVKLLTSKRAGTSDEKHAPLVERRPHLTVAVGVEEDLPLDQLYQPPVYHRRCGSPHPGARSMSPTLMSPPTLMHQPMGISGDMLRRTFSSPLVVGSDDEEEATTSTHRRPPAIGSRQQHTPHRPTPLHATHVEAGARADRRGTFAARMEAAAREADGEGEGAGEPHAQA